MLLDYKFGLTCSDLAEIAGLVLCPREFLAASTFLVDCMKYSGLRGGRNAAHIPQKGDFVSMCVLSAC